MKLTMKMYPVAERKPNEPWSESRKEKMITLRSVDKLDEGALNKLYDKLRVIGYSPLESGVFMKIVRLIEMREEHERLNKKFEIWLQP